MNNTETDWLAVKQFYQACRSYKQTAAHFGISPSAIKNRAIRGGWSTAPAPADTPTEVSNGQFDTPAEVSNEQFDTPVEVSSVQVDTPIEVSSGQVDTSGDTSRDTPCTLLPTLRNFTSREVEMRAPWSVSIRAREDYADKAAFKRRLGSPETEDCIYSGILGLNRNLRVGRDNPPASLVAVVADYDLPLTDKARRKKLDRLAVKPNFVSRSFSGGTHAVWLLERPLPLMPDAKMVQELLKAVAKGLKLSTAFGTLDAKAFYTPGQYYHAGWCWEAAEDAPIPESTAMLWFDEALEQSRFCCTGEHIPLDIVAAEVEKRFPGRWDGPFEPGARGVRFWDEQASNPTAAIVRENGMTCFTGRFPFRSWQDIFGEDFVARHKGATEGRMLTECYFVDNAFYVRTDFRGEDGVMRPVWQQLNRQNMESYAAQRYGLSPAPPAPLQQSPVKKAIAKIITENSLAGAVPFIYRSDKIVTLNGLPHLNTSFVKVHAPDMGRGASWGDGFPWTAAFLERLFPDAVQRERFMAAWAHTYRNAYLGRPVSGHTVFIAGEVGVGKNFLTECLYGPSLGGYADASEHLLGRTRFNSTLFNVGVWTCNDTVTKGDAKERAVFAKGLKKMAANQLHVVEAKFRNANSIPWCGRVLVTLNTDPMSMQVLPDVDISNRDKISLYKTSDAKLDDPDAARHAKEEMGALCAFLMRWEIPEHCKGDARWGVRNYLHPDLYAEATTSSSTASFGEILTLFAKDMFDADGRLQVLEGSATWFLQQMLQQDGIKEMLRGEVTARSIGRQMSALASSGAYPLAYARNMSQRLWSISRKAFEEYMDKGTGEEATDELMPF